MDHPDNKVLQQDHAYACWVACHQAASGTSDRRVLHQARLAFVGEQTVEDSLLDLAGAYPFDHPGSRHLAEGRPRIALAPAVVEVVALAADLAASVVALAVERRHLLVAEPEQ